MAYGEVRTLLKKANIPKELEYACRYIWDLPTISAQKMVELIKKYNEGTADNFERSLVEVFRSHVADYQDREVWEYFFPGEEMPEPTRWWEEPMRLREEMRKKKKRGECGK